MLPHQYALGGKLLPAREPTNVNIMPISIRLSPPTRRFRTVGYCPKMKLAKTKRQSPIRYPLLFRPSKRPMIVTRPMVIREATRLATEKIVDTRHRADDEGKLWKEVGRRKMREKIVKFITGFALRIVHPDEGRRTVQCCGRTMELRRPTPSLRSRPLHWELQ